MRFSSIVHDEEHYITYVSRLDAFVLYAATTRRLLALGPFVRTSSNIVLLATRHPYIFMQSIFMQAMHFDCRPHTLWAPICSFICPDQLQREGVDARRKDLLDRG